MPFFRIGDVVKSGLDKMSGDEIKAYSLSLLHAHCDGCFDRKCRVTPDGLSSCAITDCPNGCGQMLHSCKIEDHKGICMQEKISCINKQYGCPVEMFRAKLASHIRLCPASVVRCVIEWNRWPMHSIEDKIKVPLPLNDSRVKCAQYDVALALRDQRMLLESMKAPKKTRKVLQNPITRMYPSVPFENQHSFCSSFDSDCLSDAASVTVSDDECEAPWENNFPPGLKASISKKLYKATKQTSDTLSATLNIVCSHCSGSQHSHLTGIKESEEGGKVCAQNSEANLSEVNGPEENLDLTFGNISQSLSSEGIGNEVKSISDNGSKTCKKVVEGKKSVNYEATSTKDKEASKSNSSDHVDSEKEMTNSDKPDTNEERGSDLEGVYKKNIKLCDLLGVSLTIESISKYIPKPKKMFTFLCAQDFRREEYPWHIKNVHTDIHCGLNANFEQRCPLAYRGCTFTFQGQQPKVPAGKIVYSTLLESFGLVTSDDQDFEELLPEEKADYKSYISEINEDKNTLTHSTSPDVLADTPESRRRLREATPEIVTSYKYDSRIKLFPRYRKPSGQLFGQHNSFLLSLPFEVLQIIGRYLDSFSLCNLAVTSHRLRDVCCSLLVDMGMVTLVWEKEKNGSEVSWTLSHKKWCFSTSFHPIHSWGIVNKGPFSDHMQACPCLQEDKNIKTEKWMYTGELTSELVHKAVQERNERAAGNNLLRRPWGPWEVMWPSTGAFNNETGRWFSR